MHRENGKKVKDLLLLDHRLLLPNLSLSILSSFSFAFIGADFKGATLRNYRLSNACHPFFRFLRLLAHFLSFCLFGIPQRQFCRLLISGTSGGIFFCRRSTQESVECSTACCVSFRVSRLRTPLYYSAFLENTKPRLDIAFFASFD